MVSSTSTTSPPIAVTGKFRFGPFELDTSQRELRKHGARIRISPQPLRVLIALIEAGGLVVTRDRLHAHLWPHNNYGDFEHGLNVAVKKLRDCLGDSAADPRYIETVEREGYRFVAVVTGTLSDGETEGALTAQAAQVDARSGLTVLESFRSISPRLITVGGLAVLALLPLALAALVLWPTPAPHVVRFLQLTHSGAVHPNQNLLTDGPRLYYIERVAGKWVGKWMLASGGPATALDLPFEHYDLQDISQDGGELIVREFKGYDIKDLPLWAVSTAGGAPRPIAPGSIAAAYAPDGRSFFYSTGNTVFQAGRDGSGPQKLLQASGEVESLAMRENVLRMAIGGAPSGVAFWEAQLGGRGLHRVLDGRSNMRLERGSWSPDGRWFAFSAARNQTRDLWLLGETISAHPVQLTSGPLEFTTPVFSRDGKRIFCIGLLRRGELMRYDPATGQFAPKFGGISAEVIEYSPDHESIIYVSYPEGLLWRARADGTDQRQLTAAPMRVLQAHWSPDGAQILFEAQIAAGMPWNLRLMASMGGSSEELPPAGAHGGFSWSSDGNAVVIGDVSSDRLRVLNVRQHTVEPLRGSEGLANPVFAPGGRYLVATTEPAEDLVLFDLGTHTRTALGAKGQYPTWSADAHYIYFNNFSGSAPAMYRLCVADRKVETLFALREFSSAGSWGTWSSVAPDGSILLTRDTGTTDVYAIEWQPR